MRWTYEAALERLVAVCEGRYSENHNAIIDATAHSAREEGIGARLVLLEQAQAAEAQKWSALAQALAAGERRP